MEDSVLCVSEIAGVKEFLFDESSYIEVNTATFYKKHATYRKGATIQTMTKIHAGTHTKREKE